MATSFEDPGQDKPYASILGGLLNTAVDVGKQYLPKPKAAAVQPAAVPQVNTPVSTPAWLKPVLIGGGVLLALVVLLPLLLGGRGK